MMVHVVQHSPGPHQRRRQARSLLQRSAARGALGLRCSGHNTRPAPRGSCTGRGRKGLH